MADLEGKTIASTYESLLNVGTANNQNLDATPRVIADGVGTASKLFLATDSVLISGDETKLFFYDNDGDEHIRADNAGILFINAGAEVQIDTAAYDLNASGAVTIDSSGGTISIGSDAVAQQINIGTGGVDGREVVIGNTTGASGVHIKAGTGDVQITGNLGIAVSSPTNLLEIAGSAFASKGHASNTIWGYNAGDNLDGNSSNSQRNTYIGYTAGDAVHDSANDNTGVGYYALTAITGGDQNTAMGSGTLQAVTTGQYNTAFGFNAGVAIDTSSNNTAVGRSALAADTGNSNTAVGYGSLTAATGAENVAVGMNAGVTIVAGANNTFVGNAADGAAAVNNQIAIGSTAVTTGQYGIAIGDNLSVAGNDFAFGRASNVVKCDFDADATFARNSDGRKKRNIKNDTLGLEFINDLRTVTYQWKPAEEHPEEWHAWNDLKDESGELTGEKEYHEMNTDIVMHGMISQEVKAALDTANVDTFKGWNENLNGQQLLSIEMFVFPLIKAVQELSAKVTALENA